MPAKVASLVAQTVKNLPAMQRPRFDPWVGKIPWRREWQPTPVRLPGETHGGSSLVGYNPWGRKESDTTKRLHFTYLVHSKIEQKLHRFLKYPLPTHMYNFPHNHHLTPRGTDTFVTISGPTLTHHHHPKSRAYIRVHF